MDISGELELTVLVLFKAKGSAWYLSKAATRRESASITISSTVTSHTDSLFFGSYYQQYGLTEDVRKRISDGTITPTHVVSAVSYGQTLSLHLTSERSDKSGSKSVKGKLEGKLDLAGMASIAGNLKVDVSGSDDTRTTELNLHLEGQGFHIPSQPTSLEEAANLYHSIMNTGGTAVPIKITMAPISWTGSVNASICYELGRKIRSELIHTYSRLLGAETTLSSLRDDLEGWQGISHALWSRVNDDKQNVTRLIPGISHRFSEYLIAARTSGNVEDRHKFESLLRDMDEITTPALSAYKQNRREFTQLKSLAARLRTLDCDFYAVEKVQEGMLYASERILVIVRPERDAGDVLELESLLRVLKRWRKFESKTSDDIPVNSIYADEVAIGSLNDAMDLTAHSSRSIDVFVWSQPNFGDRHRWERVGGTWHYLATKDDIYIGEVKTIPGGRQMKHGKGQLESFLTRSISSGTWRVDSKHGLIAHQTNEHQASSVQQRWRHGVLSNSKSEISKWITVKITIEEATIDCVMSTADSADQVIATVTEELEFHSLLANETFFVQPCMDSVLEMPMLRAGPVYGNNGWKLECWGFGLPGSLSLHLRITRESDIADCDLITRSILQPQDHFNQPRWVHFVGPAPSAGFDWSLAQQTGCQEAGISSEPFAIARAEIPLDPSNIPAAGLVLGKAGKHLEDGRSAFSKRLWCL